MKPDVRTTSPAALWTALRMSRPWDAPCCWRAVERGQAYCWHSAEPSKGWPWRAAEPMEGCRASVLVRCEPSSRWDVLGSGEDCFAELVDDCLVEAVGGPPAPSSSSAESLCSESCDLERARVVEGNPLFTRRFESCRRRHSLGD